jgi:hypothetical protein
MKAEDDSEAPSSVVGSLPATIEPSDLPRLNEALAYLFQELAKAIELHRADTNAGREGAIHSVETVTKFLSLFSPVISSSLHAPLVALFDALMNLDDGVVAPILRPVPHGGRSRASAVSGSIKGVAAFTVDRLCATGLPAASARKLVAQTLRAAGLVAERGRYPAITERTIRGWRENVAADVGRKGEAAQTFDLMQQDKDLAPTSGRDPASTRRELLHRLGNLIRRTRSGEKAS